MGRSSVKKHNFVTYKEKLEILKKLEKGFSGKYLAAQYGIAKSTVTSIKKNKDKILRFASKTESGPGNRRTLKKSEMPQMEEALFTWLQNQRRKGAIISTAILCEKAKELNNLYKECTNFIASRGWLSNFKHRHGVRILKVCGEKLSSNKDAVEPFIKKFHEMIEKENFSPEQIYNADESGLFWRLLPDKTLVVSTEKSAPGRKSSKERVTFLLCTNATGSHKLKPLVIGKARNPRVFKHFEKPVIYESNKNAWMTREIFQKWFENHFVPEITDFMRSNNLPTKGLLLLDNAACHTSVKDLVISQSEVKVMFFPANVTALIQPMDMNVINLTKIHYKKLLLYEVVSSSEDDITKAIKAITLRHAVQFLLQAFSSVSEYSIKQCWKNIMPQETEWDEEDVIPLETLKRRWLMENNNRKEISELISSINNAEEVTEKEITHWINEDQIVACSADETSDEENDRTTDQSTTITHGSAINSLNILLEWGVENHISSHYIDCLTEIKEIAIKKSFEMKKQSKITQFFSKF